MIFSKNEEYITRSRMECMEKGCKLKLFVSCEIEARGNFMIILNNHIRVYQTVQYSYCIPYPRKYILYCDFLTYVLYLVYTGMVQGTGKLYIN